MPYLCLVAAFNNGVRVAATRDGTSYCGCGFTAYICMLLFRILFLLLLLPCLYSTVFVAGYICYCYYLTSFDADIVPSAVTPRL